MAATFHVDLVSPERMVWSGEATMVITRVVGEGEIAFMAGHAPFLGALSECHTRVFGEDGTIYNIAVHGGVVMVHDGELSILSDDAELGPEIDVERARVAFERAEGQMRHEHDAEVESALRRAHARLSAAGGLPAGH